MKKLLLATALAGSLALGGCATTGGTSTGGGVSPDVIAAVQQFTQSLQVGCAFLPTFQTVQDIIVAAAYPAGTPIAVIANQVGNAICAAVTAKSARLNQKLPTVRGVVIHGQRISR